jgi:hypothetical protein
MEEEEERVMSSNDPRAAQIDCRQGLFHEAKKEIEVSDREPADLIDGLWGLPERETDGIVNCVDQPVFDQVGLDLDRFDLALELVSVSPDAIQIATHPRIGISHRKVKSV